MNYIPDLAIMYTGPGNRLCSSIIMNKKMHMPGALNFMEFSPAHITSSLAFWAGAPGIALSAGDDVPSLSRFLDRNRGLSELVLNSTESCDCPSCARPEIIATLLAGHDGRRGFLYHVLVANEYRGQGLGRQLVERAMGRFAERGIPKVHIMCLDGNGEARRFWESCGFNYRSDLALYSKDSP